MEKNYRFDKEGKMNQVDKELMQEKGILTENEKADEYEIQKRNAARIARRRSIHPSYGYLV